MVLGTCTDLEIVGGATALSALHPRALEPRHQASKPHVMIGLDYLSSCILFFVLI
jgi:hypothetical protein